MKKLLIVTGPQGSGNHVWSKIFALAPRTFGWQALLDEYWIGHDREPFAEYWKQPDQLELFDWSQADYFVTSISCPYMLNGDPVVPNFQAFISGVEAQGIAVIIAILGRDKNILAHQETRVRGQLTLDLALAEYCKLTGRLPFFLSYELLQLYKTDYLKTLNVWLKFPVAFADSRIEKILADDTNSKYYQPVQSHWTDELAKKASSKWQ